MRRTGPSTADIRKSVQSTPYPRLQPVGSTQARKHGFASLEQPPFWLVYHDHDVNARRRRSRENEDSKCDDTETRKMTVCHARDVSKNKASVRAEGRMALALPHTAHVVGSQKERGGDAKKTVRSGRSSGRAHGLPINEDTRADVASAQLRFPLRCVALRCLISERVG
jgi:hypothetical protein